MQLAQGHNCESWQCLFCMLHGVAATCIGTLFLVALAYILQAHVELALCGGGM